MSHRERDLTPLLEHVARAQYDRAREARTEEDRSQVPTYDHLPAHIKLNLKQTLLPLVMDVLTALDTQDQQAVETDVLAALEAQFTDPGAHSPEAGS